MFFAIDSNNDVTTHDAQPEAAEGMIIFASQKDLAQATAGWPTSRYVELWNSFAGTPGPFNKLKEIRKFQDRKAAVNRIWSVLQALGKDGGTAPEAATTAPVETAAPAPAPTRKNAPKAPKGAKKAKAAKVAKAANKPAKTADAGTARKGTKMADVIAMMERKNGATMADIQAATAWLAHTVRGFVSGTLGKKMGLTVESFKTQAGDRAYRITK